VVPADARRSGGFNLVDTLAADQEDAILQALGAIAGCAPGEVAVHEIALTHAREDDRGSLAALVERTGATVTAPAAEVAMVEGRESLPPPNLREWDVPIWAMVEG
jgi:hypothetical protein